LGIFGDSKELTFYQILMSFGKRLQEARKSKNVSQEELARFLGTKGPVIGRYERDEMKPSIEVAAKMAGYLDVSLDFLVGKTELQLDQKTVSRIVEVQKLPQEIQEKLFYFIDMSIRDFKAKQAYAS